MNVYKNICYIAAAVTVDTENLKRAMWLIILGMIIALVFIYFTKTVNGALVRALMENGAYSPDGAKTLDELGFDKKTNILKMYKKSPTLGKTVASVEDDPDENAHFYIREQAEKRASEQYGTSGNELLMTVIGAAALVIIGALVQIIL